MEARGFGDSGVRGRPAGQLAAAVNLGAVGEGHRHGHGLRRLPARAQPLAELDRQRQQRGAHQLRNQGVGREAALRGRAVRQLGRHHPAPVNSAGTLAQQSARLPAQHPLHRSLRQIRQQPDCVHPVRCQRPLLSAADAMELTDRPRVKERGHRLRAGADRTHTAPPRLPGRHRRDRPVRPHPDRHGQAVQRQRPRPDHPGQLCRIAIEEPHAAGDVRHGSGRRQGLHHRRHIRHQAEQQAVQIRIDIPRAAQMEDRRTSPHGLVMLLVHGDTPTLTVFEQESNAHRPGRPGQGLPTYTRGLPSATPPRLAQHPDQQQRHRVHVPVWDASIGPPSSTAPGQS
jgi:hypothetical protein